MSLLILQTQAPESSLATDSYGVIATAAMLDQELNVVYCGEGLKQLNNNTLHQQLQNCLEFGVKQVYACTQNTFPDKNIHAISADELGTLIQQSTSVLSF